MTNCNTALRLHSFPVTHTTPFFAFQFTDRYPSSHNSNGGASSNSKDGWALYDATSELRRQGLPNESWTISKINSGYELCETYPRVLGLPKAMSEEEITDAARFRSRGRIPVLSWMHPESLATITRCSQPLIGVSSNRSRADEKLVRCIMEANAQAHRIFIFDARPKLNSMVNVVNGGGYESEDVYTNAEFSFLDIHNIHVMRESLRKVREMCFPVIDDAKWLTSIENTQWLNHLHCILSGAVRIAEKVESGKTSVMVHCSDGWDRTAQLTSLAMLLLDPYYRTLVGFEALIEKEWLSFGHKFAHRIGHGVDKHNNDDRSPVFLQWIDCVWQVANQFPNSFEFNEYFLTFVLDHLYSCLFGTFLYNCEKERRTNGVQQGTQSLWTFVNHKRDMFLNPQYNPLSGEDATVRTIIPDAGIRYMKLWTGYYCRWNPRMRPQDLVRQRQSQMLSITGQLKTKVDALKKELESKRRTKEREQSNSHFHFHQELSSSSHSTTVMTTKYEPVNI